MAFEPGGAHPLDRRHGLGRPRTLADQRLERLVGEDAIGRLLRLARPFEPERPEPIAERIPVTDARLGDRGSCIGPDASCGADHSGSTSATRGTGGAMGGGAGDEETARRSMPPNWTFARSSSGSDSSSVPRSLARSRSHPVAVRLTTGRNRSTSEHSTRPTEERASSSPTTSGWRNSGRMPKVLNRFRPQRSIFSAPDPVSICATVVLPNRPFARATPERTFRITSRPASESMAARAFAAIPDERRSPLGPQLSQWPQWVRSAWASPK